MNDDQIELLKQACKKGQVLWCPDSSTALQVRCIGKHAEEGDDEPCAIFTDGKYAALYNAEIRDFMIAERLG